ncbi:hypothetical protein ACHAXR_011906 [Thalassiosira sp. AJA248-18]
MARRFTISTSPHRPLPRTHRGIAAATKYLLILLLFHPPLPSLLASAYQFWSENEYLSNFEELELHSYSAVNDPDVAPATLLSECRREYDNNSSLLPSFDGSEIILQSDGTFDAIASGGGGDGVPTVSAASAQAQCGGGSSNGNISSVCIVPRGLRLIMSSSLNVPALIVRGELYWRDSDQVMEDQFLCAGYVAVESPVGKFVMTVGTSTSSSNSNNNATTTTNIITKRGWIYVKDNGAVHPIGRSRFFGGVGDSTATNSYYDEEGPTVEITGRKMKRTWSLLSHPFKAGQSVMKLMHSPTRMGWRIGDRIGVSPTQKGSDGSGQTFRIVALEEDGSSVRVDSPNWNDRQAMFLPPRQQSLAANYLDGDDETRSASLLSAEVVNLSRNIIITGDDLTHVTCDSTIGHETQGCKCSEHRSQCTVGLHTAQMNTGYMSIRNVRVEKCGQRGIDGKYCLHFHRLSDCPTCEFSNNVIEHGHQRGIIVHGTHRSLVENNVLWDVRGAGIYVEDGNEMSNRIQYNVVICPWSLADPTFFGCTVPGTANAESDTPLNHAGIYTDTAANDFIGNRVSNSFNGLLLQASGTGRGAAYGRVCTSHLAYGRFEGNTFHGHSRFGLYTLGGSTPRITDQSIANDGFNVDQGTTCDALTDDGLDRGKPVSLLNNVDYDTVFVGHYNAGDMQHRGHTSYNNNNLIYWKETKNFADGCGAHISEGYYAHGNMALPDQGTFIIERSTFDVYVVLEANHHCNVGVTGLLCMPAYILHDVKWKVTKGGAWILLQRGGTGGGGVFSLSPPNADAVLSATPEEQAAFEDMIFPPGYVSLASGHYVYLTSINNNLCVSSNTLGLGDRYYGGILCKASLRVLKIWSTNLQSSTAPSLRVEVWLNTTHAGVSEQDNRDPDITQLVNFHAIAGLGGGKQGYSLPVFTLDNISYRLSLDTEDGNIPGDWIIEFSDPVMGNRWGEEFINLSVQGRVCENGGVVSSQHSRRYMYGLGIGNEAWGNSGACVNNSPPKMHAVDCSAAAAYGEDGTVPSTQCPDLCFPACDSTNSFCHCGSVQCVCKPGFTGADCSIDLCSLARCGEHGTCSARYLGDASTLPVANEACVCDEGWSGPLCNQQNPINLAIKGNASQSSTCWGGTANRAIDGNTDQGWGGNSMTHTCLEESPWWMLDLGVEQVISQVVLYNRWDECCRDRFNDSELQILDNDEVLIASKPFVNGISTNYIYFDNVMSGRFVRVRKNVYGELNIAEIQVFKTTGGCINCPYDGDDCQILPGCNVDGSCPTETTFVANGTPCNSKPMGTCQDGQCIESLTLPPTLEPTLSPITFSPTQFKMIDRTNLVLGNAVVASQSTTCHGGVASRAIDGNTDGNWYHNSVSHTCNEPHAWLLVDLSQNYEYVINRVSVYNRNDCCMDRLSNSEVQILNDEGTVIASELIPAGAVSSVFHFDFDNVSGRYVRVYKPVFGELEIAEVKVMGWSWTKSPTISPISPSIAPTISETPTIIPTQAPTVAPMGSFSPTLTLINLALVAGAQAQQSSHYQGHAHGASVAIDGIKSDGTNHVGSTHTQCSDSPSPWWRVYFGHSQVKTVKVYNRVDCCWSRLQDFTVSVLDDNMNVIASQHYPGTAPRYEAVSFDFSSEAPLGQYVEVKLGSPECLSLSEVEVFGHPITPPVSNIARGANAVASQSSLCWGGVPNRAIDGNTNGHWSGNSIQHTCDESNPWWMVDLGESEAHVIESVSVYNRVDCCTDRNSDSDIEILDDSGNIVASKSIAAGDTSSVYNLNFDDVGGRYIRFQKKASGISVLNIAEVKVMGWSLTKSAPMTSTPTQAPTQTLTTGAPTTSPTLAPLGSPTRLPTDAPRKSPTDEPTNDPTTSPTPAPSGSPTLSPTDAPIKLPTVSPAISPTIAPTRNPTYVPTHAPTKSPVVSLTFPPTNRLTSPTDPPTPIFNHSSSPTLTLINLALVAGAQAQQSSHYQGHAHGASVAIDGIKSDGTNHVGSTHTQCSDSPSPWWRVYFGHSQVKTVKVYNRVDCCWSRLQDFTVSVLDDNMNVIASQHYPGTAPRYEAVSFDFSSEAPLGQYVEVKLGSPECLSLSEVEVFGHPITPPVSNIARGANAVASQSSLCWGGVPNRAIDGNTNGHWSGNSIQHTCDESNPWWMVDLGESEAHVIESVSVYNRVDCCTDRNSDSDIEILDDSGNIVASKSIAAGDTSSVYNLNFDDVGGRYIRFQKKASGISVLNIAEVKVMGWSFLPLTELPTDRITSSPTPSPPVSPPKSPTPPPMVAQTFCGCPQCILTVWNTNALKDGQSYTCGERITFKTSNEGGSLTESDACAFVANEFPNGPCGPVCNSNTCTPTPPPTPNPSTHDTSNQKCGGAVDFTNDPIQSCQSYLWSPTNDDTMHCFAYGGSSDPCHLNNNNDQDDGIYKDPSLCLGDTLYLWDEPDTQGRDYTWAGSAWLDYSRRFTQELVEMRGRGTKVTGPLLKAGNSGVLEQNMQAFLIACGTACFDPADPAYIDVVAINAFCGPWNGDAGCRGGAKFIYDEAVSVSNAFNNLPVYITNWSRLQTSDSNDQVDVINSIDEFFPGSGCVERVYWFGARDYGGEAETTGHHRRIPSFNELDLVLFLVHGG